MRSSRPFSQSRRSHGPTPKPTLAAKATSIFALLLLVTTSLLPAGSYAARERASEGLPPSAPPVTGADYTLNASNFQSDPSSTQEESLKDKLAIPPGSREAVYTSEATKAPVDFTDIVPRWWIETPEGTSALVDLRSSPDGKAWDPWQPTDLEDLDASTDTITETYAGIMPVVQKGTQRTHRYVQSRVSLRTDRPGTTPVFHSLTYSFIDAGVTPRPPRPQAMAMGTPSDIPKPVMVPRSEWGSPEGKSSPRWTPKFKRVTNIIIHHTATPNNDTDYAARVRAIWYFHAKTRRWGDIGYNYVIDPNGVIYEGRAGGDDVEAGHAYPFNSSTMGIGMLGNFMNASPTAAAQAALIDLISWKASQRGIDPLGETAIKGFTTCEGTVSYIRPTIAGHRDYRGTACGRPFNKTTCPGDRLWGMLPQIRAAVIGEQPPLRAFFTNHDTPGNIGTGATVNVRLSIRNSGSLTWTTSGQGAVSLGYRWLMPDGQPVKSRWQDIKTSLPASVAFADTVTVTAKLAAPEQPGHYALLWDLQRDGQGWFADQGSRPLRLDVVVGSGIGDQTAPASAVLPLPVYSSAPEIPVRWAGKDDPKGSGLASYDVQYRIIPQGSWTDWKSATADLQATFEGLDGYTYGFRSRARDAAGNVEAWSEEPDAYTAVDTRPPSLAVDTPQNGAHVQPGALLVRGRTEPGTFVAVNDRRAEEQAGVFTSTVEASGRDFQVHVTAADAAGNISRLEITVQAAPRYNDVPMTHPAFTSIEYLSDQGVVAGYGDGSFRPDTPFTRAQLAKTLASGLRWGLIKPEEPRFSDVAADSWAYPYVETAAARKVMDGYPDGSFRPNLPLTRAQALLHLVAAAGWKPKYSPSPHFLDVGTRHRLYPYLETAYYQGIVTPDEDGNFNPNAPASRAFVSTMVYNLLISMITENPPGLLDDQGPDQ